jgi:hypothetical protein
MPSGWPGTPSWLLELQSVAKRQKELDAELAGKSP